MEEERWRIFRLFFARNIQLDKDAIFRLGNVYSGIRLETCSEFHVSKAWTQLSAYL
jgi:hypothetical protein